MDVTISIPEDIALKLRERASAHGQDVPHYTSRLVEQAVKSPTLEELLAPIQGDFVRSGMTNDDLIIFGRELLEKVREQGRG